MMTTSTTFGQTNQNIKEGNLASNISGVVFSGFPSQQEDYKSDVQEIRFETVERFGLEEWRLVTLTSELHGHLGIYAIIGAKMGLYAMEVLGSGYDELTINSFAGSKPPVSCLNDGLQVSTGATLGHGQITILEVSQPVPSAEFSYKGKTISLSLKDTLFKKVSNDIRVILSHTGGLTPEYWQKIRELGLVIWLEYDRKKIFNIIKSK